jgi:hypothetical protein
LRKKPAENHRIGNVGDVKLVKAQQPRLLGQLLGDEPDRVLVGMFAEFHFLSDQKNAFVNVEHEFMEMRAAFSLDRTAVKKQIHQHRFAATDLAIDIKALDR